MFDILKKFFNKPEPVTSYHTQRFSGIPRPNEYGIIEHPAFKPSSRRDISINDNVDSLGYQPDRSINISNHPRRRLTYSFEQTHPLGVVFNPTAIGVSGVVTGIDLSIPDTSVMAVSGSINIGTFGEPLFTSEQIKAMLADIEEKEKPYIVPDTIVPGVL